ncbi:hypothetical protein AU476_24290 [Cupriavidus sp. UYMSc13B]|nr:hypothetical protein AU476_24290 [Cupriavidus sp. UYMSc13B]
MYAQSSVAPQPGSAAATSGGPVRITKEHLQAAMPPLAAHFDEIDTNHQAHVMPVPIQQYVSKHQAQMPPPPQMPSPPRFPQ